MTTSGYPQPPPTKASLKTWWNHFTFAQKAKREADERRHEWEKKGEWSYPTPLLILNSIARVTGTAALAGQGGVVFGKPLKDSLAYASVQISTANANGELYVWGYIPVVVAKWCVAQWASALSIMLLTPILADCISRRMVRQICDSLPKPCLRE